MVTALLIALSGAVLLIGAVVVWYTLGGAGEAHAMHDTSRHHGWEDTSR